MCVGAHEHSSLIYFLYGTRFIVKKNVLSRDNRDNYGVVTILALHCVNRQHFKILAYIFQNGRKKKAKPNTNQFK